MKKKDNGITLIALVITIIVMLILVGVTVNVAITGGLFNTAREATRKTNKAILNEEINPIIAAMNMDIVANPQKYKNEYEHIFATILAELEKNFEVDSELVLTTNDGENDIRILNGESMISKGLATIDEDTGKILLTVPCKYKGNDVNIIVEIKGTDEGLEVIEFRLEEQSVIINSTGETPKLTVGGNIKELTEEGVPIPKGFYYVTGTKNTGVVISDSEEDENKEDGNSGNQYVWVPVETNQKLNIKVDTGKVIKTVRILNLDGYDETFEPNSDYFEKTIDLNNENSIYEIIITYEDGSTDDKIYYAEECYDSTLDELTFKTLISLIMGYRGETEEEAFEEIKATLQEENPEAELKTKIDIIKETLALADKKYSDEVAEKNSVLKYGGFYIGRYEKGMDNSKIAVKKGINPSTNVEYENAKTEAEGIYNTETYGVKSSLPSGVAWDRICYWIVSTKAKTESEVYIDSSGWGNYYNPYFHIEKTGSESRKANNIFDLAGNVEEWTTEIENNKNVSRGGYYRVSNGFVYERSSNTENSYIGYRPILYFYE